MGNTKFATMSTGARKGFNTANKCECCKEDLKRNCYLKCSLCPRLYNYSCIGLGDDAFRKLSPVDKSNWICPCCKCNKPKTGDNTNTPIKEPDNNIADMNPNPSQSKSSNIDDTSTLPGWYKSLEASITSRMQTLMTKQLDAIKASNDEILRSVSFLNDKYDELLIKINSHADDSMKLKKENEELKVMVSDLSQRLSLMEQYSRECNIEISCLPEFNNENLTTTVMQIGRVVSSSLQETDISACKRVAKLNPSNNRPRSVIVKLNKSIQRDEFLAAVTKFNKTNPNDKLNTKHLGIASQKQAVYVTEHLSPQAKSLHAAVRLAARNKGYRFTWVRNGRIFVRKDEQPNSKSILIKNDADIQRM